ncbi:MAG: aminotransferase class V-fold PLP-dependent enzyme, partial [Oricola sp.]|nr:aminotransferase class V-fold PLP-dependent enzyme [Oricola sp.]
QTADVDERAPTFSFVAENKSSEEIAEAASNHKVAIRHGDFYAKRLIEALGIDGDDGVVRCSMAHYNTLDEAKQLVDALDRVV